MARLIPVAVAVVAIAVLTVVEGNLTERWGDNRHSAYCATLVEGVPDRIGAWVGEDSEVDPIIQKGAGARGYVSRVYRRASTGDQVDVWLICGHARDTARHTPNVCYPGSGFSTEAPQVRETLTLEDGSEASFWTARFLKASPVGGDQKVRVFWCWFKPKADSGEPVSWRVPESDDPKSVRGEFGAAPALYKLYFTVGGSAAEGDAEDNISLEFAKEFLAAIDPVLAPANGPIPDDFVPPPSEI